MSVKFDEDAEEELDKPGTTIGTEVFRIADYPNPVFNEMWFFDHWSIRKNTRFHRKAFRAIILLACFSRTFIVKNIPNSLTHTLASSCVCTSPLAVMTIVGLHDFVKVSIWASLKSFFADHVQLTLRTRQLILVSSGFQRLMQAGTYFPEMRRMLLFSCSF